MKNLLQTIFILLLVTMMCSPTSTKAQNLLVDGSFCEIDTAHSKNGIAYNLLHWHQLDVQEPLKQHFLANKQKDPQSTYIELSYHYMPPSKESHCFYTIGALSQTLELGVLYDVNITIKRSHNSEVSSNDIGVGFIEKAKMHSPAERLIIPNAIMKNVIVDKEEWMEISGTYLAQGNEHFIVLGQFLNPEQRFFKIEKYSVNTKEIAKVGKTVPWLHMKKFPFGTTYFIDEVIVSKSANQFISEFDDDSLIGTKLFNTIEFEYNSNKLKEASYETLDQIIHALQNKPSKKVEIVGHTDSDGESIYNLKLSRARAISVANYFVEKGIARERISVNGKGEMEPLMNNSTEDGKRINRRVEMLFIE